jgi:hypothetical protein
MQRHIAWLWIVGFFGLVSAANAQTSSPTTANTQYDGAYKLISATSVNETWVSPGTEHTFPCGYQRGGPLAIFDGQARFSNPARDFQGIVGPHGEFTIRGVAEPASKASRGPGTLRTIIGSIDSSGTVRARMMNGACYYDLIWQKTSSVLSGDTRFDGRYAFVSLTQVNEQNSGLCRKPISLIVTVGEAWLPHFYGKVASGGELTMRAIGAGDDRIINGRIDGGGTVRASEIGRGCAYDFVWQKVNE